MLVHANPVPAIGNVEFTIRLSHVDGFVASYDDVGEALAEATAYTLNTGLGTTVYRDDVIAIKSFEGWKIPKSYKRSSRWSDLRFES